MDNRRRDGFFVRLWQGLDHVNRQYHIIGSQIETLFLSSPFPARLKTRASWIPPIIFVFIAFLVAQFFFAAFRRGFQLFLPYFPFFFLSIPVGYLVHILLQRNDDFRVELHRLSTEVALLQGKLSEAGTEQLVHSERLQKLESIVHSIEEQRIAHHNHTFITERIRDLQKSRSSLAASALNQSQQMEVLFSNVEALEIALKHQGEQVKQLRTAANIAHEDLNEVKASLEDRVETEAKTIVIQNGLTSTVEKLQNGLKNQLDQVFRMVVTLRSRVENLETTIGSTEAFASRLAHKAEEIRAETGITMEGQSRSISNLDLRLSVVETQIRRSKETDGSSISKADLPAPNTVPEALPLMAALGALSTRLDHLEHSHTVNTLKTAAKDHVIKQVVMKLKKEVKDFRTDCEERCRHVTNIQAQFAKDDERTTADSRQLEESIASANDDIQRLYERMKNLEVELTHSGKILSNSTMFWRSEFSAMKSHLVNLELASDGRFRVIMATYGNLLANGVLSRPLQTMYGQLR